MRYSHLLFDLDGTITDPKIGITTCVQYALDSFGIHETDLEVQCHRGQQRNCGEGGGDLPGASTAGRELDLGLGSGGGRDHPVCDRRSACGSRQKK